MKSLEIRANPENELHYKILPNAILFILTSSSVESRTSIQKFGSTFRIFLKVQYILFFFLLSCQASGVPGWSKLPLQRPRAWHARGHKVRPWWPNVAHVRPGGMAVSMSGTPRADRSSCLQGPGAFANGQLRNGYWYGGPLAPV